MAVGKNKRLMKGTKKSTVQQVTKVVRSNCRLVCHPCTAVSSTATPEKCATYQALERSVRSFMLVESDGYPGALGWGLHTFYSFSPQTTLLSVGSLGVTVAHATLAGTLLPCFLPAVATPERVFGSHRVLVDISSCPKIFIGSPRDLVSLPSKMGFTGQIVVAQPEHIQQLLKLKQQAMQQQKVIQPQASSRTSPEGFPKKLVHFLGQRIQSAVFLRKSGPGKMTQMVWRKNSEGKETNEQAAVRGVDLTQHGGFPHVSVKEERTRLSPGALQLLVGSLHGIQWSATTSEPEFPSVAVLMHIRDA
ncbi:hypothetical protein MDA_GLEAN10008612 [Myotis davidii]|uniref:Uncharacterized protein n=1 Tax=Myotis davidii TaxID=225400 RepID=L5LU50_MYODS|nr:hypothetical protein MDA_GLEAN10008612 [Myotis davidii]